MWKIEAKDLPTLSEHDRGLLFNYFGSKGGVVHYKKTALLMAVMGCLMLVFAYWVESIVADASAAAARPAWYPYLAQIMKVLPILVTPCLVAACLAAARTHEREADRIGEELAERGLDVSGISSEQVFKGAVLPMIRRSGVRVRED